MARTLFVFAVLVAVAGLSVPARADVEDSGKPVYETFENYIGRPLVAEDRASKAGLHRMLPLSCPPFHLRDKKGNIINPVADPSVTAAVSSKETCGACHDYEKVTRGYHFQMGRTELRDESVGGEGISPHRGPGFFGKWLPLYQRELAPKKFEDPTAIDMTPFEWITDCGICHPGGGPAEFDRSSVRYDQMLAQDHGLSMLGDSDYFESSWDRTGVVEADCFICHLETYDYSTRVQQIKKMNFQWASTAAAGLGHVWGSVKDKQTPKVYYTTDAKDEKGNVVAKHVSSLFGPDGKVSLKIRRPADRQCMFCHDMSSVQKRGSSWHSNYMQDVHTDQGLACIDCHQGDIRHNFAKGSSSSQTVRENLDNTQLSCRECHEKGEFGAPIYDHPGLPPVHLERISCQACHITHRPFVSVAAVDSLTGAATQLPVETDLATRDAYAFGAMWGRLSDISKDAFIAPFTPQELERAARAKPAASEAKSVRELVEQQGGIASEAARVAMLEALQQVGAKEKAGQAVCVFRGTAYVLKDGKAAKLGATVKSHRPGATIAESPYSFAKSKEDGLVYPESAQLGVFWAYLDGEVARPVFLGDMEAAWKLLHGEEWRFYAYPGKIADGAPTPGLPKTTEIAEAELRTAMKDKLAKHAGADRRRLDVYDDNNDSFPEANTQDEIALVAWALKQAVPRLAQEDLYYVKGERAFRVQVQDWKNPFGQPLPEMVRLDEGAPFIAIDRFEWRRYVDRWEFKWRWEFVETRLAPFYQAEVAPVDLAEKPAIAELAQRLPWTVAHGVEPASQALGAASCTDCHSSNSHFFFGKVEVDPFSDDATPETVPMHKRMGYDRAGALIAAWREGVLKPWAPWAVLAVALIILLHFALFGIKGDAPGLEPNVLRFRVHERISHLVIMVTVVFLAATGFLFLLGKNDPLGPWARQWHAYAGYAASAGFGLVFLVWVWFMFPAKGDFVWLLKFGGYMGGKGHVPAGKFNAGQKVLFWMTVGLGAVLVTTGLMMGLYRDQRFGYQELVYTVHDTAALMMILMLLGHIYLATAVVPHSLRSLFGGKVSDVWAKEHHSEWVPPRPE